MEHKNIVFFDGVCNLCNETIQFLIRRDKKRILRYASLQSSLGQEVLQKNQFDIKNLSSIIYRRGEKFHTESTAVIYILSDLGGFYKLAQILFIFPVFIRNTVYRWISKNRYKWFGKKESCMIPTPELKELFLAT